MYRYENEKAAYLLYAKMLVHKKKVEAAIQTVKEALSKSKTRIFAPSC